MTKNGFKESNLLFVLFVNKYLWFMQEVHYITMEILKYNPVKYHNTMLLYLDMHTIGTHSYNTASTTTNISTGFDTIKFCLLYQYCSARSGFKAEHKNWSQPPNATYKSQINDLTKLWSAGVFVPPPPLYGKGLTHLSCPVCSIQGPSKQTWKKL